MSVRRCKSCEKDLPPRESNSFEPFCSKRCSLVDLGKWFDETYRIPSRTIGEDEDGGNGLALADSEFDEID